MKRLALAICLVACGESSAAAPATREPVEPVPTPAPETEPPAALEPAVGDPSAAAPDPAAVPADATICDRARLCCAAYVAAIPSARRPLEERACAEMDRLLGEAGEATDEACEAAIGGWRQSLQLTGIDVPVACAE